MSCSSRIPDPDPDFLPIPDPGSWIQASKRHRIPDRDPQHCIIYIHRDFRKNGEAVLLKATVLATILHVNYIHWHGMLQVA